MLLIEKMKQYPFSSSERTIVDFILEKQEDIKDYTTKAIAKETYTSPSVLVRIAKKLGYQGYNEFKEDYLKEVYYLHSHFEKIDANYPFTEKDNTMTVAGKIASVYEESARDTR